MGCVAPQRENKDKQIIRQEPAAKKKEDHPAKENIASPLPLEAPKTQPKNTKKQIPGFLLPTFNQAKQLSANAAKLKEEGSYDLALEQYQKSLDLFEKTVGNDSEQVKSTLYEIGDLYERQGKHLEASQTFYKQFLIWAERYGVVIKNQDDMREEMKALQFKEALSIDQYAAFRNVIYRMERNKFITVSNSYNGIGEILRTHKQYEKALKIFEESLKVANNLDWNSVETARTHKNIGSIFQIRNEYDAALKEYQKAQQIYENTKGRESLEMAVILISIGNAYKGRGTLVKALQSYKEGITIYRKLQLKTQQYADAQATVAQAYKDIGNYQFSAEASQNALSIYEELGLADVAKSSALNLARCLKKLWRSEELNKLLQKYGILRSQL